MTSPTGENTDQSQEFISLFDLLKFTNAESIVNATYQICSILEEENKTIDVYQYHTGIKPRLTLQKKSLYDYLLKINRNGGYKNQGVDFNDDIPF